MPSTPSPQSSPISKLPNEILTYILAHCDDTHDVLRETTEGLKVSHGTGSRNLLRVCRRWRDIILSGLVRPSVEDAHLQLTHNQFFAIVSNQSSSGAAAVSPQISTTLDTLRRYRTLTIIYDGFSTPHVCIADPHVKVKLPEKLRIVVTGGCVAYLDALLVHFTGLRPSLLDMIHMSVAGGNPFPTDPDNDLELLIWDGYIATVPTRIPHIGGTAILKIRRWPPSHAEHVPHLFAALLRALCEVAEFHILGAPAKREFTSKWTTQAPGGMATHTGLKRVEVTGLSGDDFLRLVQCSAMQVVGVETLMINKRGTFWDWRMFDPRMWPVIGGGMDGIAFCAGALRVGEDIWGPWRMEMEVGGQIAEPGTVARWVGRPVAWWRLRVVEVEGADMWDEGEVTRVNSGRLKGGYWGGERGGGPILRVRGAVEGGDGGGWEWVEKEGEGKEGLICGISLGL